MGERPHLPDQDVSERLARLDELLGRLEEIPGATAETALDAVRLLAEVYGEALGRVMTHAARDEAIVEGLVTDALVGHLMVLHDVHPEPVEARVARALESVRPYVRSHGGDLELSEIRDGVARIRMSGSCGGCGASARTLDLTVKEAVLAAAPELSGVEPEQAASSPERTEQTAFIPLGALATRAPQAVGDSA